MTKEQVIDKFCNLSVDVRTYLRNQYGADCFCKKWQSSLTWTYEDRIFEFIEAAVKEKMERDGPPPSRWIED